jgi:hypothetical protein
MGFPSRVNPLVARQRRSSGTIGIAIEPRDEGHSNGSDGDVIASKEPLRGDSDPIDWSIPSEDEGDLYADGFHWF